MPVVVFKSSKLDEKVKDNIALEAYEILSKSLHIPHIELFFDEYEAVYAFGKKHQNYAGADCIVEGPKIAPNELKDLSYNLMKIFRKEMNDENFNFTLVYHENDDNHVTLNEELLAEHRKKLAK